jgi:hypothetical protein
LEQRRLVYLQKPPHLTSKWGGKRFVDKKAYRIFVCNRDKGYFLLSAVKQRANNTPCLMA